MIARENNINPKLIRKWKTFFTEKAGTIFEDPGKGAAETKPKEANLEKKQKQRLSMIG